jgi:rare lipoprotein A (peptidoglycan hydrolase)
LRGPQCIFLRAAGNELNSALLDRVGGRDRRGDRRVVIIELASKDDAMKWTLMVTTCLLAFAFSPPAFARQTPKEPDAKVQAQHIAPLARHHASSSRHGRFVAARNRTVGEVRGGASEGGSVGLASYYSASGMTAAHRTLPFGTRVRVTNLANGHTVIVRINDRGPFIRSRSIDLSAGAARAIGMTGAGVARVRMHVI